MDDPFSVEDCEILIETAAGFQVLLRLDTLASPTALLQRLPQRLRARASVDLLVCALAARPWPIANLGALLDTHAEATRARGVVIEAIQEAYQVLIASGQRIHLNDAPNFASADEMRLRFEREPIWLGEWLESKYQLMSRIGAGRFGCVYEAISDTGARFAIKLTRSQDEQWSSTLLHAEFEAMRNLNHPSIARVHEFFNFGSGCAGLVMELLDGRSLREVMQIGPIAPSEAVPLLVHILSAIDYTHQRRLVHRDLKPENILVRRDGHLWVTDFGTAIAEDQLWGRDGEYAGTHAYAAPESLFGMTAGLDGRTDLYSVGVIFYEMLTGELPHRPHTREEALVRSIVNRPAGAAFPESVPIPLQSVIQRCLQRDPNRRYDTAQTMLRDLRAWENDASIPGSIRDNRVPADMWKLGFALGEAHYDLRAGGARLEPSAGDVGASSAHQQTLLGVAQIISADQKYKAFCELATYLGVSASPVAFPKSLFPWIAKGRPPTGDAAVELLNSLTLIEQQVEDTCGRILNESASLEMRALFELGYFVTNLRVVGSREEFLGRAANTRIPASMVNLLARRIGASTESQLREAVQRFKANVDRWLGEEASSTSA